MSNIDIIRAWKDEEYRNSLSQEQRSQLPENPAGMVELSNEDMEALAGGRRPFTISLSLARSCQPFPIYKPLPFPVSKPGWYKF